MKTVEFNVEACQDDTDVRGNAMASGDDDFDRECEDKIIADLDDGNIWAWASVRVSACIDGVEGMDHLGCCNYKDEEDFLKGGYYLDMKGEALRELRAKFEDSLRAITLAEGELVLECAAYDKRMAAIELWRCPHCKDVVAVDPDYDDIPFCADCDTQRDRYDPIDVVFLRDSSVFAVFPGEAANVSDPSHMTSYAHIGQHCGTSGAYCEGCKEVTDPAEYADLAAELDRIGYNLRVVRKDCMGDSKYTDSRREQLQM